MGEFTFVAYVSEDMDGLKESGLGMVSEWDGVTSRQAETEGDLLHALPLA